MKMSTRKELLKEAEIELNKIQLRILLEDSNMNLQDKVDKISSNIIVKKDEEYRESIYEYLKKLQSFSESMQEDYEEARKKGISLDEWFETQTDWKKAIYQTEMIFKKSYKNRNLWNNLNISLTWILRLLPWAVLEDDGKFYDKNTGKLLNKPEPETGLDPLAKSSVTTILRAFTL